MRLVLKDEKYAFTVTKAAEPKTEFGSGQQKMNRASKLPEWVVEVLAMDSERGEVIRVTVTGDQPKVSQGQTAPARRSPLVKGHRFAAVREHYARKGSRCHDQQHNPKPRRQQRRYH